MGYSNDRRTILETYDDFVREIPLDDWRTILVYRREHGGREFVRFRTWNRHRLWGVWYPTKRCFVIPMDEASALADSIRAAANGEVGDEPDLVGDYDPASSWFKDSGR